jgi:polyhydroxyalkanoate synthesis regulator phasin
MSEITDMDSSATELTRLRERVVELEEEVVYLKCVPWRSCEGDCDHDDYRSELREEFMGVYRDLADTIEGHPPDWSCDLDRGPQELRGWVDRFVSKQKEEQEKTEKKIEGMRKEVRDLRRDLERETKSLKYLHKSLEGRDDIKCLIGQCKGETYLAAKKNIVNEHGIHFWREWRKEVTWGIIDL